MSDMNSILRAKNPYEVCLALQKVLDTFRANKKVPDNYQDLSAKNPEDIQSWFDVMKSDEQIDEEGILKEIYGLYQGALQKLRDFGFHRE